MVSGTIKKALNGFILVFLLGNLVIRLGTIFNYPPFNGVIAGFLGVVAAACVWVVFYPRYLKHLLFIFGFSFFLFGFGSIDLQSRIFELVVTLVATTLFVINWRRKSGEQRSDVRGQGSEVRDQKSATSVENAGRKSDSTDGIGGLNRPLLILLLCYVGLSAFSLLLLPVRTILKDLWFFGFPDGFFYLFIGPPYSFYYPVAMVIQLALFVTLAVTLSSSAIRMELYKSLFTGIFSGAVFCAFIGLLDFYGIISLAWYRFGETISSGVLHSTFQNRNCFGEFVLTVIPFVMIGFLSRIKGLWWKIFLFGCLVICEIALILAGGRAGWVTYPLVLFICWLFSYFSKEGRLQSFRFRLRDVLKVAISVPVTIVISLLLVFYVFMPLGDQLKDKSDVNGINRGSEGTRRYLESRMKSISALDVASRDRTWGQGFAVGRESPIFGMGYESFFWQGHILNNVSGSYFSKFRSERERIYESPHNVLLSVFVSGGIVGVGLWALIIGYAVVLMIMDLAKNKRLMNTPVIISIISFHMYGMVQSMQYIPMIWLLIFLCLGYAMTLDEGVLPGRFRRIMSKVVIGAVVAVGVSLVFYVYNFESRKLAEKYDLNVYAMEPDRDRFAGFYPPSKRWKYGDYRWCGKRGAVYFRRHPGETPSGTPSELFHGAGRTVELEFHCRTPGVEEEPVVVRVFHEGEVLDRVVFGGEEERRSEEKNGKDGEYTVRRRYQLPETAGEEKLMIEVSRTWVPHNHLGNFDRRELGVGVKKVNREEGIP